jgi:predicted alpha/beta superfamily hydrolase
MGSIVHTTLKNKLLILTAFALSFLQLSSVQASPFPEVSVAGTQVRELHSTLYDRDYLLSVSLPQDYDAAGDKTYPTLYILDGNMYFETAVQSYQVQTLGTDVPPMIIVGIEYPTDSIDAWLVRRAIELTPSNNTEFDTQYTEQYKTPTKSGAADTFLKVLAKEIIPFVNRNYKTSDKKALFGHSLGGLFATYSLLQPQPLFDEYLISSPSLWWDDEMIFKHEESYLRDNQDLSARVLLSVGSLEGPLMVPPMQKMGDILKSRNFKSLDITTHVFDNETHLSVQPGTLSRGLRAIFDVK